MELKLIRSRGSNFVLTIDGYTYYKHGPPKKNITKWVCKCKKTCYAWAKTIGGGSGITLVRGGPETSIHKHPPDLKEVLARQFVADLKAKARDQPEAHPALILRAIGDVDDPVLSQLSDRQNLRKAVAREKLRDLPTNPLSIEDLGEIPDKYKYTYDRQLFLCFMIALTRKMNRAELLCSQRQVT